MSLNEIAFLGKFSNSRDFVVRLSRAWRVALRDQAQNKQGRSSKKATKTLNGTREMRIK